LLYKRGVLDLRIYRASFVAGLLAFLVVMFSLQERPRPLGATLAPDAFNGTIAQSDTAGLVKRYPDRRPGGPGDEAVGTLVQNRFRALGFQTYRDSFHGDVDGDSMRMSNVVGTLSAPSDRQVVVMAPRDAEGRPGASIASDTAVLLELAGALDGSSRKKTFVFVSLDGSAADSAGARRFADTYKDKDKVDAVLVLDDIGAASASRPFLIPWASDSKRGSIQVLRTASAELAREAGVRAGSESWGAQYLRQAWPLTLGEQGPLVSSGMDALTLTSRGEVPREGAGDTLERLSDTRLGEFGRAAFGTLLAFDGAQTIKDSPSRYLVAGRKVIPAWAIALLGIGFTLPALIASVDAYARGRRRGLPVGGRVRWALASVVPFLVTLAAAFVFQIVDWLPGSAAAALSPATAPTFGEALAPLVALALIFILAWIFVRPLAMGRERWHLPDHGLETQDPSSAVALAFLVSLEVMLVCVINPFAGLVLVPVAHLCALAALPDPPRRRILGGATLAIALALPALAILYYGARLDLGLDPSSYALMLLGTVTDSPVTAALFALVAGTLSSVLIECFGGLAEGPEDMPITVRGPASYAGPGSLGGTESALRR
jgi:Peptidase family M28